MAKKALGPRPQGTGAKRTQVLTRHTQGNGPTAASGRIAWAQTLAKGRPRSKAALCWQQGPVHAAPLWLVLVDASASTRRNGSLARAKGFLQTLFDQAYRQRARLALLTASGSGPQWQRQGLKASAALRPWLEALGAGGGTPLLTALGQAREWLDRQRKRAPGQVQRCVVVTDGRIKSLDGIEVVGCEALLVDIELGAIRLGKGRLMAERLEARYVHIDSLALAPAGPGR